jgi:hypothetical protein
LFVGLLTHFARLCIYNPLYLLSSTFAHPRSPSRLCSHCIVSRDCGASLIDGFYHEFSHSSVNSTLTVNTRLPETYARTFPFSILCDPQLRSRIIDISLHVLTITGSTLLCPTAYVYLPSSSSSSSSSTSPSSPSSANISPRKWHCVAYFSASDWNNLPGVEAYPELKNIIVPEGVYMSTKGTGKTGPPTPGPGVSTVCKHKDNDPSSSTCHFLIG